MQDMAEEAEFWPHHLYGREHTSHGNGCQQHVQVRYFHVAVVVLSDSVEQRDRNSDLGRCVVLSLRLHACFGLGRTRVQTIVSLFCPIPLSFPLRPAAATNGI